jgi:chromosomal replication initiator protein
MATETLSHAAAWEQILNNIMSSGVFTDQIKSYLDNATVVQIDDESLVLGFPNMLTKNFVDSSGILSFIQASILSETGNSVTIETQVSESAPDESEKPSEFARFQVESKPTLSTKDEDSSNDSDYFRKFTFDSFVVGESNRLARGAALAVAENPAKSYNPLFIYGKSGLGKTHLLIAIYNYVQENHPSIRALYLTARDLVDDIVNMSRQKNWELFSTKYTSADMLLIDDIQYLEGKEESIERVFQLLNTFITITNKQIVLSADRSPRDLNMDERMTSRFLQGLPVDIQPPTFETKVAVLKNCRANYLMNSAISDDVLEYIASISNSNIREIEGALTKVDSYLFLTGKADASVELAKEILRDYFPEKNSRKVSIKAIQSIVEKTYNISHEDMVGSRRSRNIVWPRQIAMYLSRNLTEESYPTIGSKFGGRDHTTIMHGVETVERKMKNDHTVYDEIERLSVLIKEKA